MGPAAAGPAAAAVAAGHRCEMQAVVAAAVHYSSCRHALGHLGCRRGRLKSAAAEAAQLDLGQDMRGGCRVAVGVGHDWVAHRCCCSARGSAACPAAACPAAACHAAACHAGACHAAACRAGRRAAVAPGRRCRRCLGPAVPNHRSAVVVQSQRYQAGRAGPSGRRVAVRAHHAWRRAVVALAATSGQARGRLEMPWPGQAAQSGCRRPSCHPCDRPKAFATATARSHRVRSLPVPARWPVPGDAWEAQNHHHRGLDHRPSSRRHRRPHRRRRRIRRALATHA